MDLSTKRHSYAHILAQAIKHLYGNEVKMAIWPDTENGFFYDFDFNNIEFSDKNLKEIEKEMQNIIKQGQEFVHFTLPAKEALKLLEDLEEPYKIELAQEIIDKWEIEISFYANIKNLPENFIEKLQNHKTDYLKLLQKIKTAYNLEKFIWNNALLFLDMCAGPHVNNTKELDPKAFKLNKVAWAYWKWDENNKMLTRIYGYAFDTKEDLKKYLDFLEEAKKRDHRVLWQKLWLYTIKPEEVGAGLILWKPKWAILYNELAHFIEKECNKRWYIPVRTPHIGKKRLWEISGHWWFYNESMFPPLELWMTLEDWQDQRKPKESETYLLKPMNCPFHVMIYKDENHSYRELPIRYWEFGTVYRYEKKWELGWLTRVRGFTQDDAHIVCTPDQIKDEIWKAVDFVLDVLKTFGFNNVEIFVSLSDPNSNKYVWPKNMWELAEKTIEEVLDEKNISYKKEEWEAAFYWPKIDFKIKDSIGRLWQCSTIQFDFNLPERFNMTYTDKDWNEKQPFMVHRAIFGSFERFIGILIEHFAGTFPLWLAPIQARIIPVSDKFDNYAKEILNKLKENEIRADIDLSDNSLAKKIRNAEKEHINYILVVWEKEANEWTVSVRNYKTKEQNVLKVDELINNLKEEINTKKI